MPRTSPGTDLWKPKVRRLKSGKLADEMDGGGRVTMANLMGLALKMGRGGEGRWVGAVYALLMIGTIIDKSRRGLFQYWQSNE